MPDIIFPICQSRDLISIHTHQVIDGESGVKIRCKHAGKDFAPEEISAQVLRKLTDDAAKFLNDKVQKAVITVPAYFNDSQRQAGSRQVLGRFIENSQDRDGDPLSQCPCPIHHHTRGALFSTETLHCLRLKHFIACGSSSRPLRTRVRLPGSRCCALSTSPRRHPWPMV